MNHTFFQGVCTALVTPFENGAVSIKRLKLLLDRQLEAGISAIVICGTTGESPTLTDEEKLLLLREAKHHVGKNALIIAGTGSNCTAHAVDLSKKAADCGADGLLVVTPYYNKASQQGLYDHYAAIAQAAPLPVILYNVPSRTGVDLPVSLCKDLAALPNIAGIKEASPDLRKVNHLIAECPPWFSVWSGNDDLLLPMISLGAQGVISVASNLIPREMKELAELALAGRWETAQKAFRKFLPLIDALFSEVNPIPVKAAMEMLGLPCGGCRLPLTDLSGQKKTDLQRVLTICLGQS